MKISELLDNNPENSSLNSIYNTQLNASNIEEVELIQSIAKLLFKTKSLRKTISIIDREVKRQEKNKYYFE